MFVPVPVEVRSRRRRLSLDDVTTSQITGARGEGRKAAPDLRFQETAAAILLRYGSGLRRRRSPTVAGALRERRCETSGCALN